MNIDRSDKSFALLFEKAVEPETNDILEFVLILFSKIIALSSWVLSEFFLDYSLTATVCLLAVSSYSISMS